MPLIHRVDLTASSPEALEEIQKCLQLFVEHQLCVPNPGVLVYHFSRPDPENRPFYMEYFEVYKDDAIFWSHTSDKDHKFALAFMKAFDLKNIKSRAWYCYGDFDDEEKMKVVCEGLGATFPENKLAGFYINSQISRESLENTEEFLYLKFSLDLKKEASHSGLRNAAANVPAMTEALGEMDIICNKEILTFFAHAAEPKKAPNKVEVLLVLSNNGLKEFLADSMEIWSKVKSLCVNMVCDVYGSIHSATEETLRTIATEIRHCTTDIGYIIHPQAKDVFV